MQVCPPAVRDRLPRIPKKRPLAFVVVGTILTVAVALLALAWPLKWISPDRQNRRSAPTAAPVHADSNTVVTGDFSGDGRSDLAVLTPKGRLLVGLADTSGLTTSSWALWSRASSWHRLLVGDFDGDRRDDILGIARDGGLWVARSQAEKFHTEKWDDWSSASAWHALCGGDFNGDGRTDVAGLAQNGSWWIGLSQDSRFHTSRRGEWKRPWPWHAVRVGDFDGDRRHDILGMAEDGGLWVARFRADRLQTRKWDAWSSAPAWHTLHTGDFNGDGRTDVAGLARNGTWWIGLSQGSRFHTSRRETWSPASDWRSLHVGDFDGDGRSDLAGLARNATWRISHSDGTQLYGDRCDSWSSRSGWESLQVGDFDGDGKDAVAGCTGEGAWWVGQSTDGRFRWRYWGRWHEASPLSAYTGELPPFASEAPWNPDFSRKHFEQIPASVYDGMFFNTETTYRQFVENYFGVLRKWTAAAERRGCVNDAAKLRGYLRQRLDAKFADVGDDLRRRYPGLSRSQYRALMTMNVAHAYFAYASATTSGASLVDLLRMERGDCSEITELNLALLDIQGIDATYTGVTIDYEPDTGHFRSGHYVAAAEGMWLDAEINVAFHFDPDELVRVAPQDRLQSLLDGGRVYGFYNWYLKPDVRQRQLDRGYDGGTIAFYYYFYFDGMGQGNSVIYERR